MNIKLATLATLASALTISKFIVSGTSLWQKTWLSYFLSIRSRTCSTSGTLCGPATDCYWCHPQVLDHQLSSSKQLQCTCWVERQCQWPSASFRCELSPRQCTPTCTTLCCWPCVLSAVLMCCKCECCKCIANLLSGPFVKCVLVCPHHTTQLGACTTRQCWGPGYNWALMPSPWQGSLSWLNEDHTCQAGDGLDYTTDVEHLCKDQDLDSQDHVDHGTVEAQLARAEVVSHCL